MGNQKIIWSTNVGEERILMNQNLWNANGEGKISEQIKLSLQIAKEYIHMALTKRMRKNDFQEMLHVAEKALEKIETSMRKLK